MKALDATFQVICSAADLYRYAVPGIDWSNTFRMLTKYSRLTKEKDKP